MEFIEQTQSSIVALKGSGEALARNARYLWIRELDRMRGMRPDEIHFVGHWLDLEGSGEIETYARMMRAVHEIELHGLDATANTLS